MWQKDNYDHRADLWSLGVVLYEAVSLHLPFSSQTVDELYLEIMADQIHPLPPKYSPELANLIMSLLKIDRNSRPTL